MENKSYESITFDVEKDLSKPNKILYYREIKDMLSSIFVRGNDYKNHSNSPEYIDEEFDMFRRTENERQKKRENEPMEILHYNFDTENPSFWNYGKKSLIRGLMEAYEKHYPITISSDMILILFLQGYSRFMEKYSEKLRNQYVNFEGKKH